MEMTAKEDIEIGPDITSPIPPLSFSVHHCLLHTHCSACFSPRPPYSCLPLLVANSQTLHNVLHCSPRCSSLDSSLRFSSAEHHLLLLLHSHPHLSSLLSDSTDLRVALRFLHSHGGQLMANRYDPDGESEVRDKIRDWSRKRRLRDHSQRASGVERVAGLLTNRGELMANWDGPDGENDVQDRIRAGSRAMAAARAMRDGCGDVRHAALYDDVGVEEEVAALCLVVTNAVELQDEFGRTLGIGGL